MRTEEYTEQHNERCALSSALSGARRPRQDSAEDCERLGVAMAEELPWWAYSPRGIQLWYPSSAASSNGDGDALDHVVTATVENDPELEFDREVRIHAGEASFHAEKV